MKTDPTRQDIVRYWWEKAEECIFSAQREYQAGALDFTINRLYYSLFYAVSAALFERQLSFKKHAGVRSAFHQTFINSGLIEERWGKFYDGLFEDRQEGDYLAFQAFEPEYVMEQMELVEK